MTERERLIELCDTNCGYVDEVRAEDFADYLIKNGVIALPCRVGDMVYVDSRCVGSFGYEELKTGIYIAYVVSFTLTKADLFIKLRFKHKKANKSIMQRFPVGAIDKTIFLSKHEAEQAALKIRDNESEVTE